MTGDLDLTPRSQHPLCLLDIDGGYRPSRARQRREDFTTVVAGFPVTVAVAAQERLSRLAEYFHIVWASAWMRSGSEALAPLVGLPNDVRFIRFDPDADERIGTYKLSAVQQFARDRPVAWVDDELGEDVVVWATQRDQPTLLVHTDPRIGLVDEQIDELWCSPPSSNSTAARP